MKDLKFYIENKIEDLGVIHTSHKETHSEIIPDSVEDVFKLLKLYCHPNHQNHLGNTYLVLYNRDIKTRAFAALAHKDHKEIAYIDLDNLERNIRNKNLNKILS